MARAPPPTAPHAPGGQARRRHLSRRLAARALMALPLARTAVRLYRQYPAYAPVVGQLLGIAIVYGAVVAVSATNDYDAGAAFVTGLGAFAGATALLAASAGDGSLELLWYVGVGMVAAQLPCMVFASNAKELLALEGADAREAPGMRSFYEAPEVRKADVWNDVQGAVLRPDLGGEAWIQLPPPEDSDARMLSKTSDGWTRLVPNFGLERQAGVDKRATYCAIPLVPANMSANNRPWDMRYDAVHAVLVCHNDWQGFVRCADAFSGNYSSGDWWGFRNLHQCYRDAVSATSPRNTTNNAKAKSSKLHVVRHDFNTFEAVSYMEGRMVESVALQNPLLMLDANDIVLLSQEPVPCCSSQAATASIVAVVCMLLTFLPLLFNLCYSSYTASAAAREALRRKNRGFAGMVPTKARLLRMAKRQRINEVRMELMG